MPAAAGCGDLDNRVGGHVPHLHRAARCGAVDWQRRGRVRVMTCRGSVAAASRCATSRVQHFAGPPKRSGNHLRGTLRATVRARSRWGVARQTCSPSCSPPQPCDDSCVVGREPSGRRFHRAGLRGSGPASGSVRQLAAPCPAIISVSTGPYSRALSSRAWHRPGSFVVHVVCFLVADLLCFPCLSPPRPRAPEYGAGRDGQGTADARDQRRLLTAGRSLCAPSPRVRV